jgi:hypothetical protein
MKSDPTFASRNKNKPRLIGIDLEAEARMIGCRLKLRFLEVHVLCDRVEFGASREEVRLGLFLMMMECIWILTLRALELILGLFLISF